MSFAAAFFSYSETAAAIFIIGCDYSIKVYFFQTKFTLCRQFAYISCPSHPQRHSAGSVLLRSFSAVLSPRSPAHPRPHYHHFPLFPQRPTSADFLRKVLFPVAR